MSLQAFPNGFLALVDTYDTLTSGMLNFLAVSLALTEVRMRRLVCYCNALRGIELLL